MPSNLSSRKNRERAAAVFIPLLFFQLALLSFQIQNPAGVTPIKMLVLAIQAPIVNVSSALSNNIGTLWSRYVWLVGARAENEQLREAVRQLTRLNLSYEQVRLENIRLNRLLAMKEGIPYATVGARVIARTPGFLSNVLYINRGSRDGVEIDAPVICADGIIGRTVLVAPDQSQVQLITNPDASIGVMMENTRTLGVLSGSGSSLLDLKYVSNTEQIHPGDVVLSSGFDTIFPKGFKVGEVVDCRKGEGVFYQIRVEPAVDFYHIEEVSVILTKH
ncbi:MAG: rod shape-determining protein MreC [Acidobacteria bacterium]|nr:rod shape-determining protein MreC [Acidobacteriota bacterium]